MKIRISKSNKSIAIKASNGYKLSADRDDYCPHCCNRSLKGVGDGRAICDSCGEEYEVIPMSNNRVKLLPIQSSTITSDVNYQVIASMSSPEDVYSEHATLEEAIASAEEAQQSFMNVKIKDIATGECWLDIEDAKYDLSNGAVEPTIFSAVKSAKDATWKTDKRLAGTSERYRGYLIVFDRGGDGYNVYDKHRELEDVGYPSKEAAKQFIDELVATDDDVYSAESVEQSAIKMIITVGSGINVDGFDISIVNDAGDQLFKSTYSYGYNASYDKKFADWAQRDYDNSVKHGWTNKPALKPYVSDIIDELCEEYNVTDIEVVPGKNVYTGNQEDISKIDEFKSEYLSHISLNSAEDVISASYGGAFDIEDDQYFTKDEIVEFGNTVCDHLNETFYDTYEVSSVYMETPKKLVLTVAQKSDESEFTATVDIDMRKIKRPSDLMDRYLGNVVYALQQDIEKYNNEVNSAITAASEVLTLDTKYGDSVELEDGVYYVYNDEGELVYEASSLESLKAYNSRLGAEWEQKYGPSVVESAADTPNGYAHSDALDERLWDAAYEYMETLGYYDDEIRSSLIIDVQEQPDRRYVDLRAELNYDELTGLLDVLDPIVQEYDANAYFEPVAPGIAEAYIYATQSVNASTKLKRIARYGEFDNGRVFHDWQEMSDEDAEAIAKEQSIADPNDIYYVVYDDIMNPDSGIRWIAGKSYPYQQVSIKNGKPFVDDSDDSDLVTI